MISARCASDLGASYACNLGVLREQVKCLHLDVELLEVDRAAMRGPLAELLGFAPLSDDTRKMLAPPA